MLDHRHVDAAAAGVDPNGSSANTSLAAARSHGHGCGLAFEMSARPTHSSSRPACSCATGSGHTAPSGLRSPDASCARRSMTIAAVTPYGRSTSARQPGPSSRTGDGKIHSVPSLMYALIAAMRSARTITFGVGGCTSDGSTAGAMIGLSSGRPTLARTGRTTAANAAHPHHGR